MKKEGSLNMESIKLKVEQDPLIIVPYHNTSAIFKLAFIWTDGSTAVVTR